HDYRHRAIVRGSDDCDDRLYECRDADARARRLGDLWQQCWYDIDSVDRRTDWFSARHRRACVTAYKPWRASQIYWFPHLAQFGGYGTGGIRAAVSRHQFFEGCIR